MPGQGPERCVDSRFAEVGTPDLFRRVLRSLPFPIASPPSRLLRGRAVMRFAGASASRPASGGGFTTAARLREETRDACPSASPDVGPGGARSPAEVARAPPRGSPPPALLCAARASSLATPAPRAPPAPVPPRAPAPRGDRSRPFDQWSEDEKAAWRAEKEAKRAAAERKNEPAKPPARVPSSPPWPPPRTPPATRTPAPVADALPYQLIQRVLSRVPEACLRDESRVPRGATPSTIQPSYPSPRWRATPAVKTRRRDAVATWMNERGVTTPSGLIAFLAGKTARAPPRRRVRRVVVLLLPAPRRSRSTRSRARPRLRNRARDGGGTRGTRGGAGTLRTWTRTRPRTRARR